MNFTEIYSAPFMVKHYVMPALYYNVDQVEYED